MSFNSHRRKLLDESEPLERRASHARSCALLVANKLETNRESVIKLVELKCGVNLNNPESITQLLAAFEVLEIMRSTPRQSSI